MEAIALTLVLAIVATTILAFVIKATIGLRPSEEVEDAGLDISEHGEEGYHDVVAGGFGHVTEGAGLVSAAMAAPNSLAATLPTS